MYGERFRRESRLRSPQDFQRVRRRGRRVNGRFLTLMYARREPVEYQDVPSPSRVGFSVNKRVGGAVQRNRVKRRLRDAFRRMLWKTPPGWDMIFVARSEAANVEYSDIAADVEESLTRARLLR